MSRYSCLSCYCHIVSNLCRSCNAYMCYYNAKFPYFHIMCYLYAVIYFCSFSNNSFSCRCSVNSYICSYFNPVLYFYTANLRYFKMSVFSGDKTESVRAYNSAGMYYYIVSKCYVFSNCNIWVYKAVFFLFLCFSLYSS